MDDRHLEDRQLIRELIEAWVIWRDGGDFERLASLWRPDGFIMTTWCEATATEFIERSRRAWEAGGQVFHTVNGSYVEVAGDRAIALTKMQIIQRAPVHGVMVEVTCRGRFCDALERHDGGWGLLSRQSSYEGDAMAPVEFGAELKLDPELLSTFPPGYRHLGYLQTLAGLPVNKKLPGAREAVEVVQHMRAWLAGGERALIRSPAATT